MKKLSYKMLVLLFVIVAIFLTGCDDEKPTTWNVEKGEWEGFAHEEIIKKSKIAFSSQDTDYYLSFKGCEEIRCGNIKNYKEIKMGEEGTLYKNDLGNSDMYSWFQWIPNKKEEIVVPNIPEEKIEETIDMFIKEINNG